MYLVGVNQTRLAMFVFNLGRLQDVGCKFISGPISELFIQQKHWKCPQCILAAVVLINAWPDVNCYIQVVDLVEGSSTSPSNLTKDEHYKMKNNLKDETIMIVKGHYLHELQLHGEKMHILAKISAT